jgi:uncharacterized protein YjlB
VEVLSKTYSVERYFLYDDGVFPNNPEFPVLVYRNVLRLPEFFPAHFVRNLFADHNWNNSWKDGILTVHHYHSITHEVLGFFAGKTQLLLGGDSGIKLRVKKGDVIIIPAGVAHKNLGRKHDIGCVGAYPDGLDYDMNYGTAGERPYTDFNIKKVQAPYSHPLFGIRQVNGFRKPIF